VNGGISWSDYTEYNVTSTSEWADLEYDLQNTESKDAMVEFLDYYVYLDDIYGGTINTTAPMISVTKGGTAVNSGVTEEFGSTKTELTATYTFTNVGSGTLTITSPVAATGVATAAVDKTSLAAGESATLTITLPVEDPYGAKEGAVTVETSLGDFVINYTATTLNPNALDEQFASGKPAGWYFGGYWEVDSQTAQNNTGASGIADLITEQLAVAGADDALTFDMQLTSSTNGVNVYTSQDRVNWTEVDLSGVTLSTSSYQTITINGLAAGDYYVKIRGYRVKVDNFLGWTKKNNTRDLYVTATTFPNASQEKGAEVTFSATVTNLIAETESGVYAKLFINDVEVATADAQDIALNGTKTFSMNYTLSEYGAYNAKIVVYYSDNTVAFTTETETINAYYILDESTTSEIETGLKSKLLFKYTAYSGWNTLCVPFELTDDILTSIFGEGCKAYEFSSYAKDNITFRLANTFEAGKPYLIYKERAASTTQTVLSDINITATSASSVEQSGITFHGTFAPVSAGSIENWYGVATTGDDGGEIRKASSYVSMDGFRAYFTGITNETQARILFVDDDITTDISGLAGKLNGMENVYNLNGQKVDKAQKGLYIVNGKKTVIK